MIATDFIVLGSNYTSEAKALFARMTVQPSNQRKSLYNRFIRTLKDGGVLDRLVCLYILAAHDTQAAKLNLISSSFDATEVSSPAFVADRGFTGNGTSSYLRTNYTPASPITQNSLSFGIWSRTNSAADTIEMGQGTTSVITARRAAGNFRARINSASVYDVATATSVGFFGLSRAASTGFSRYRDATKLADVTDTSSALTGEMFICARNNAGGADFSTREIAAAFVGQSMTDTQMLILYNALNTYLVAVGAA